jgi:heat shock protein HtpX
LPQDVYLIPEVNAWVARRGGVMGFGSRRAKGLGLSLLQILTVSQFRAVLAHEVGHYYGGDTRLGPWVYKARTAMVRTLLGLGQPPAVLKALTSSRR